MEKENISDKIKNFFREIIIEAKKVDWPRKNENMSNTLIVIGISFGVAAFLGFLDFIFFQIIEKIIF